MSATLSMKWKKGKKMKIEVLKYLKDFGSITTYQAFTDLGCTRLSEYIRQLREEYAIEDEWLKTTNRYGKKVKFKKYYLVAEL